MAVNDEQREGQQGAGGKQAVSRRAVIAASVAGGAAAMSRQVLGGGVSHPQAEPSQAADAKQGRLKKKQILGGVKVPCGSHCF